MNKLTEMVLEDPDLIELFSIQGREWLFLDYIADNPPIVDEKKYEKIAYLYGIGKMFGVSKIRKLLSEALGISQDSVNQMIFYARKKDKITKVIHEKKSHGLGYLQANYKAKHATD
jgi:hypothetical protein